MTRDDKHRFADLLLLQLRPDKPITRNQADMLIELGTHEEVPFYEILATLREVKAMNAPTNCLIPNPTGDY